MGHRVRGADAAARRNLALLLWLLGGTLAAFALLLRENLGCTAFAVILLGGGLLVAARLACGCIGTALHGRMGFVDGKGAAVSGIVLNSLLGSGGLTFFIANGAGDPNAAKTDKPTPDPKAMKTAVLDDANCRLSFPDTRWIRSGMPDSIEKG